MSYYSGYCHYYLSWLAVTAVNQKQIAETGFIIFVACLVQNLSGYVVTYFIM